MTAELARGGTPEAPLFTLERLDGEGRPRDRVVAREDGRAQLLGVLVRPVPGRDAAAPAGVGAVARTGTSSSSGSTSKDLRGDARSFLERYGVTYANVYDGKGSTDRPLRRRPAFPRRTSSTRQARVRYRIAGPVEEAADLDEGIERTLSSRREARCRGAARARVRGARRGERAEADARGARVGARLPRLRDDARHLRRTGRPTDEGAHPRADRCGGRRRARSRRSSSTSSAPACSPCRRARASTSSPGCCRLPDSASGSSSSVRSPGVGVGGAARRPPATATPLDPVLERRLDDELERSK